MLSQHLNRRLTQEQRVRWVTLLLESADSSGELGVVEMQMPPRAGGPPLHLHPTPGEGGSAKPAAWS